MFSDVTAENFHVTPAAKLNDSPGMVGGTNFQHTGSLSRQGVQKQYPKSLHVTDWDGEDFLYTVVVTTFLVFSIFF